MMESDDLPQLVALVVYMKAMNETSQAEYLHVHFLLTLMRDNR